MRNAHILICGIVLILAVFLPNVAADNDSMKLLLTLDQKDYSSGDTGKVTVHVFDKGEYVESDEIPNCTIKAGDYSDEIEREITLEKKSTGIYESDFKIFTNVHTTNVVDPKNFDESSFVTIEEPSCIIPPNSFVLARTIEYFRIPKDVLTICLGKSTYARCGIIVNVTPLEPEWEGHVTLEFSNTTPLPAKIYANEGVAQMLFYQSDEQCEITYKQRGGKYMGQTGVTPPKA